MVLCEFTCLHILEIFGFINQLVFDHIQISLRGFEPVLSPATKFKSLSDKQLLAFQIGLIDGTIHLVQHDIVEKIFNAQRQSSFGIALLAIGLVDENAQARPLVNAIIVENVDAADGLPAFGQVDHQAKLLIAEQVIVAQKELLDLKTGVGHVRPAHPPDVAVVLPNENLTGILGLGTTERYRVILDEHFVQFFEINSFQVGWHII